MRTSIYACWGVVLGGFLLAGTTTSSQAKKSSPKPSVTPTPKAKNVVTAVTKTTPTQPLLPPYLPWPEPAEGGQPIKWPNLPEFSSALPLRLADASAETPPDNFVRLTIDASSKAGIRGILLYTPVTGSKHKYANQYLVLQGVGVQGVWRKKETSAISFFIGDTFRNVQLSPDGSRIFLKSGFLGNNDGYGLYSWNLRTSRLIRSAEVSNVSYDALSLDGKFLAVAGVINPENESLQSGGAAWNDSGPARLWTFDNDQFLVGLRDDPSGPALETNSMKLITQSSARRPLAWTRDNQLLYTHEPPTSRFNFEKSKAKHPRYLGSTTTPVIDAPNKYPSVWTANPTTKATSELIARAYDPSPSPDGQWIAFFGWPIAEKPTKDKPASVPSLWLYNLKNGHTYPLLNQNSGQVLWTPDSQKLVLLQYDLGKLHLSVLPVQEALKGPQHIVNLPNIEKAVIPNEGVEMQRVARNGNYLVLSVRRAASEPEVADEYIMQAVDLNNGNITEVARARPHNPKDFFSWSWFDTSDAPMTTSSTSP